VLHYSVLRGGLGVGWITAACEAARVCRDRSGRGSVGRERKGSRQTQTTRLETPVTARRGWGRVLHQCDRLVPMRREGRVQG